MMMKKSLVAIAALAAVSGAAMAQSSVTLYGVADAFVGSSRTGVGPAAITQTVINSGGWAGSRWGLRGTEDLGGGLKAIFRFESGFDISTGASGQGQNSAATNTANLAPNGTLFGREAWVGVQGDFGTFSLGRQYTAYDKTRCDYEFNCFSFSSSGTYGAGIADYAGRINNSFNFQSADYSGFSAKVTYGLDENKTNAVAATLTTPAMPAMSAGYNGSLSVKYANGPLSIGFGHQTEKNQGAPKRQYNIFGAQYDLGMVVLSGNYNDVRRDGTLTAGAARDREYALNAIAPVSSSLRLGIGYTNHRGNVNGVNLSRANGYSLTGYYSLSKRTFLYTGYTQTNTKTRGSSAAAFADTGKTRLFGVGVRHNF